MTDDRWTKIWEAYTGDPMDPKNNTEAGLRRVVELLDGTPEPETHTTGDRDLEAALEIERLRSYCQQLLDILENYQVEIEGEDNDLVALISRYVDPGNSTTEGHP